MGRTTGVDKQIEMKTLLLLVALCGYASAYLHGGYFPPVFKSYAVPAVTSSVVHTKVHKIFTPVHVPVKVPVHVPMKVPVHVPVKVPVGVPVKVPYPVYRNTYQPPVYR